MKAKKETVTLELGDGEEFGISLSALTFNELTELAMFSDNRDTKGAMNYLLSTSLRKALPKEGEDAVSDEEISELISDMDGGLAAKIIRNVQELSGLSDDDSKKEGGD